MLGDQEPQGHRQEVGGANSEEEVREERETSVMGDVRNGIDKHSEDFSHNFVPGGSGRGLGVWLAVRGEACVALWCGGEVWEDRGP